MSTLRAPSPATDTCPRELTPRWLRRTSTFRRSRRWRWNRHRPRTSRPAVPRFRDQTGTGSPLERARSLRTRPHGFQARRLPAPARAPVGGARSPAPAGARLEHPRAPGPSRGRPGRSGRVPELRRGHRGGQVTRRRLGGLVRHVTRRVTRAGAPAPACSFERSREPASSHRARGPRDSRLDLARVDAPDPAFSGCGCLSRSSPFPCAAPLAPQAGPFDIQIKVGRLGHELTGGRASWGTHDSDGRRKAPGEQEVP